MSFSSSADLTDPAYDGLGLQSVRWEIATCDACGSVLVPAQ